MKPIRNAKLRILQIGPIPPEVGGGGFGGVATHVWDLATHLAKRGHEVAILASNSRRLPEVAVIKDGVRIYSVSKTLILRHLPSVLPSLHVICKLKKRFKSLLGAAEIIASFCFHDYVINHFKPDIIHVHHLELLFPFAYFASKGEIPIVATVHSLSSIRLSTPKRRQNFHDLLAENSKSSRNLIFVSDPLKREWTHLFGDHKAMSWVINNPVDTTEYHPIDKSEARQRIGLPNEIPILLFIGHLYRTKGIYILLEAVRLLKEGGEKLKLLIAGEGEEEQGVQDFIVDNDLEDVASFEGVKKYPDILYYYNAANLFIVPSFSEGFPLTFFEAMGCGIPVIGTNILPKETIPSEDFGFRVPVSDAKALAEAIRKGMKKEWNQKKIVEHALYFSWDAKIADYEEVYEYIVSGQ